MDAVELLVARWLASCGHANVVHEPDGNVPPDFLLDGRVAVEVRRFNQLRERNGRLEGIESNAIPLLHGFMSELASHGEPTDGRSWFVFLSFRGPRKWAAIRGHIHSVLVTLPTQCFSEPYTVEVTEGITLSFCSAAGDHEVRYLLGGYSDHDAGGWVVSELVTITRFLVAEKSLKVARHLARYPEWWLVLVDVTGFRFSPEDIEQALPHLPERGVWSRIVLLDRSCSATVLEI